MKLFKNNLSISLVCVGVLLKPLFAYALVMIYTLTITTPTANTTVTTGTNVFFSTNHSADGLLFYEWRESSCSGTVLSSAPTFLLSTPTAGTRNIYVRTIPKMVGSPWKCTGPRIITVIPPVLPPPPPPPANSAPSSPVITGVISAFIGANETFTFRSTDPEGNQIRYGVDWGIDGTADEWFPASPGYVNSGVSQTVMHNWATAGAKTFQVLAQDAPGLNSAWASYTVTVTPPAACLLPWGGTINSGESTPAYLQSTISNPPSCFSISETRTCTNGVLSGTPTYTFKTCDDTIPPPTVVNGSCGSAHGVTVSVAPASNLCSAGTASVVSGSGPWNWTCNGENGGTNASCSAPKKIQVKKFWQF